jgi:hypothetical protein|tara:strand:+ start:222 stop:1718 length:1497 start_codon:yes stop_codon:yes gene_type:complete
MVFTVNPAIARQQTYRKNLLANVLGAQPGLGTNPYAQPNFNFLGQLGQGYLAGQAGAEAKRLENQQKAAQRAISQVLFGGTVPTATAPAAPQPTGFLSRAKQAIFPSVPTVSQSMGKYAGATAITPEMTIDAGADPLLFEIAKQKISTTKLTTDRANNLREATGLYYKIKTAGENADPAMVQRFRELSTNLPTELKTADYKVITTPSGKAAYVPIDILGNTTGNPTFEPSPLIDYGSKKTSELAAEIELKGTPGQRKIDESFGNAVGKLRASGDLADVESNKAKILSVVSRLRDVVDGKSDENLTGPLVGVLAEMRPAMSIQNPDALNAMEIVEEVVQRNLRVILGPQFTEKEGTRLIARAYNPYLSEELNLVRLERLANQMSKQLDYKLAAIKYFDEHDGTLKGFTGKVDVSNVVEEVLQEVSKVAKAPIEQWTADYFKSFVRPDGSLSDEWNTLLKNPEAAAKIEKRMRYLGMLAPLEKSNKAQTFPIPIPSIQKR